MDDDEIDRLCGDCKHFKKTHEVYREIDKGKRWRGRCAKSNNLIGAWNLGRCESYDDNEEAEQRRISNKEW